MRLLYSSGAFSEVRLAEDTFQPGTFVAVKCIKKTLVKVSNRASDRDKQEAKARQESLENEIQVLRRWAVAYIHFEVLVQFCPDFFERWTILNERLELLRWPWTSNYTRSSACVRTGAQLNNQSLLFTEGANTILIKFFGRKIVSERQYLSVSLVHLRGFRQ